MKSKAWRITKEALVLIATTWIIGTIHEDAIESGIDLSWFLPCLMTTFVVATFFAFIVIKNEEDWKEKEDDDEEDAAEEEKNLRRRRSFLIFAIVVRATQLICILIFLYLMLYIIPFSQG